MADAPLLYRLVLERRFAEALERFTDFPEEALWTDETGKNGILIILSRLPTDELIDPVTIRFLEDVLTTYPTLLATSVTTTYIVTTLTRLLVLKMGGQDVLGPVILRLIRANPAAVSEPDQTGSTPFHEACYQNADISILQAMLETNPSLAFKHTFTWFIDLMMDCPLDLLPSEATDDKKRLILLTSYYGRVPDSLDSRFLLHAASSSCKCPHNYVLDLIRRDPSLLMRRDKQGDLPLHCAARYDMRGRISMPDFSGIRPYCRSCKVPDDVRLDEALEKNQQEHQAYVDFLVEQFLDADPLAATVKNNNGELPLHIILAQSNWSSYMAAAIEKIDAYPDAAKQRNNKGQLPLHIVLSGNWSKRKARIIRKLVKAYPESLKARDVQDRLPPVLQSALRANESANRLSTTYELMRKTPDVCTSFLPK